MKSPYDPSKPVLPAFLPDPKDGALYMMGGSLEDPLQKLPWTIPQLVRVTDAISNQQFDAAVHERAINQHFLRWQRRPPEQATVFCTLARRLTPGSLSQDSQGRRRGLFHMRDASGILH